MAVCTQAHYYCIYLYCIVDILGRRSLKFSPFPDEKCRTTERRGPRLKSCPRLPLLPPIMLSLEVGP